LSYKQRALLLLYAEHPILVRDLFDWLEHSSFSEFKRSVLNPMHKSKLIEFDTETGSVYLSPLGVDSVESELASFL
jgi:hypothetical protein